MKFRIGAGTLITVLLALAIGLYNVYQQRRIAAQPPVVERVVQGATPSGIAPVPEFLLRHRAEIGLSAAQAQRITAIAAAYRKEIAPYQQQAETAATDYRQTMTQARQEKRRSIPELQQAGSDVQRVSSILVITRHAYWQQALAILTAPQRTQVDHLVSRVTLQDLQ